MPRFPFRRRRETGTTAEAAAAPRSPGAAKPASPSAGEPAGSPAGTAPAAPQATAAKPAGPEPLDPQQRIDGLRAWIAQLDRKLGVRTYVIGAIAILALAAAAVALVLLVQLKRDAATKDDVDAIQGQLSGVQQSAAQAAQRSVRSLNQRLSDLQTEVGSLSTQQTTSKRELQVVQDDIKELRSQISSGQGQPGGGLSGTGTGSKP